MFKIIRNILISVIMLSIVGGAALAPRNAEAACIPNLYSVVTGNTFDLVDCMAIVGNTVLTLSSKLVYISGITLNSAMELTFNMSKVTSEDGTSSGLASVWRTIRDLSSIAFIFLLLYGSINIILGTNHLAPRDLIPKIILFGLLINFSLFFCRIAIDASNMVSLAFYEAIAPIADDKGITHEGLDRGLSNAFMSSLKITSIYDPQGMNATVTSGSTAGIKIVIATILGSIVMWIAAGSFFIVTLMIVVRIAILIMLMATSPLYFVGMILPNTSNYSKEWFGYFTAQLTFLPVYLALTYVALNILTSNSMQNIIGNQDATFAQAFITSNSSTMSIILYYMIAIALINFALSTALNTAGKVGKWWSAESAAGFIKKRITPYRAASAIKNSEIFKNTVGSVPVLGETVKKGLDHLSVDYEKDIKAKVAKKKEYAEYLSKGKGGDARKEAYDSRQNNIFARMTSKASRSYTDDVEKEKKKKELAKQLERNKYDLIELLKKEKNIDEQIETKITEIDRLSAGDPNKATKEADLKTLREKKAALSQKVDKLNKAINDAKEYLNQKNRPSEKPKEEKKDKDKDK